MTILFIIFVLEHLEIKKNISTSHINIVRRKLLTEQKYSVFTTLYTTSVTIRIEATSIKLPYYSGIITVSEFAVLPILNKIWC